jgi:hypothetical protein
MSLTSLIDKCIFDHSVLHIHKACQLHASAGRQFIDVRDVFIYFFVQQLKSNSQIRDEVQMMKTKTTQSVSLILKHL